MKTQGLSRRGFLLGSGALLVGCTPGRGRPRPPFKPGPLFKWVGPAPTGVACRELGASPIVDVHCHVFSLHDLPNRGFLEKVGHPSLGPVFGNLFAKPRPDRELSWLDALLARTAGLPSPAADDLPDDGAAWFGPLATGESPLSYARRIPQRTRYRAASSLVRDYPGVSLFTPALVDFDAWIDDNPPPATRIAEQIRTYEKLAKLSMFGHVPFGADGRSKARLHPFVAFDPRREVARTALSAGVDQYAPVRDELTAPDGPWATRGVQVNNDMSALELVRRAVEHGGYLGVKLYPPVGFAALGNADLASRFPHLGRAQLGAKLDAALRALYAYCEAEEVPIMAHCSPGNEFGKGYASLVHPRRWRQALAAHPRLRLNLGHFGHLEGIDRPTGHPLSVAGAWAWEIASLMGEYPHVYADIGNSELFYNDTYQDDFLRSLKQLKARHPVVLERLLYGSDFWMNTLHRDAWRHHAACSRFQKAIATAFGENAMRGVMGENALRYLGLRTGAGVADRENRNARRLIAYYGELPLPDWLDAPDDDG